MAHQLSRQLGIDFLKSRLVLICLFDAAKRQLQQLLVVEVKNKPVPLFMTHLLGSLHTLTSAPAVDD